MVVVTTIFLKKSHKPIKTTLCLNNKLYNILKYKLFVAIILYILKTKQI